eukprot:3075867-Prymnesium_polylepis.1
MRCSKVLLAALLPLLLALGGACPPYCDNPCHELKGDPARECAGCTTERCRPGAPDFESRVEEQVEGRQVCNTFCNNPCSELSGDVTHECGGCLAEECRPGAPDFARKHNPPAVAAGADPQRAGPAVAPSACAGCSNLGGARVCRQLAAAGECTGPQRPQMALHCARACGRCECREGDASTNPVEEEEQEDGAAPDEHILDVGPPPDDLRSLDDDRPSSQSWNTPLSAAAECPSEDALRRLLSTRCDRLEDASRLKTRGFVVVRHAVPMHELQAMREFVDAISRPVQLLCGASDVQPH